MEKMVMIVMRWKMVKEMYFVQERFREGDNYVSEEKVEVVEFLRYCISC